MVRRSMTSQSMPSRGERLGSLERAVDELAGRGDGEVGAGPRDAGDAEGDEVLAGRDLALGGEQRLRSPA